MSVRIVIATVATLITVFAGAAFILWDKVLKWAFESLFPWIEINIPTLAPTVREAFAILDNISAPTRRTARQSWEKVRQYLLKQVLQFEKESSEIWVRRIISWLVPVLDSGEPVCKVKKVTTEEDVNFFSEEMLPEVRQAFIRREETMTEFNVTKIQDKRLEQDEDDLTYEN